MRLRYRQAARLDDRICVRTRLGSLGRVRFEFEQEVRRDDATGQILVAGVCEAVCVDSESFRPRRVPPALFPEHEPDTNTQER